MALRDGLRDACVCSGSRSVMHWTWKKFLRIASNWCVGPSQAVLAHASHARYVAQDMIESMWSTWGEEVVYAQKLTAEHKRLSARLRDSLTLGNVSVAGALSAAWNAQHISMFRRT